MVLVMNPKIYDLKIDVSCDASVNSHRLSQPATTATEFAHCHHTWRNAIHKKSVTRCVWSAAPATQNDDGGLQSAAPATKNGSPLLKMTRKYCACYTERLLTRCETLCWNVTKCHDACHTKWSCVKRLKPPKVTTFAALPRGTAINLTRTVATGCRRLRDV